MSSTKTFGWTQFFRDAGLPVPLVKRYALVFEDNRISRDMLMDLDKEILSEIGITAMGDVINILKHAKKLHAQEVKKKERDSMISSSVSSGSKRPPVASPHSTTPSLKTAMVSTTTSANTTTKRGAKGVKKPSQEDGRGVEVAYIAYVEPSERELLLERHPRPSAKAAQIYSALEEGQLDDSDSYQEYLEPLSGDEEPQEDYVTARYQTSVKNTRGKLYSDDMTENGGTRAAKKQQARVIMLPGEGRDIFTTNALQKAAKVYESGRALEGGVTTERSRRLLESAGLIPSNVNPEPSSVFSRLDYEAPALPPRSAISAPSNSSPTQSSRPRIIQLSKSSDNRLYSDRLTDRKPSVKKRVISVRNLSDTISATPPLSKRRVISVRPSSSKTATLYSDQIDDAVSSSPVKKRVISAPQSAQGSSRLAPSRRIMQWNPTSPSTTTIKSKMASDEPSQTLSMRLGVASEGRARIPARRSMPASSTVSRLGSTKRRQDPVMIASGRNRQDPVVISSGRNRSGVFGYDADSVEPPELRGRPRSTGAREPPTMVADEYEYQTLRQRDIRSRLEKREREKAARRGGPLAGRLGTHEVFMRLE